MRWKGTVEAILVFVFSLGVYNFAVGPVLVAINPIFADQTPAFVGLVITFLIIFAVYVIVVEYRFEGSIRPSEPLRQRASGERGGRV